MVLGSRTLRPLLERYGWKGNGESVMATIPALQAAIKKAQSEISNLQQPTSVQAADPQGQQVTPTPATLTSKVKKKVSSTIGAQAPAWIILGVGLAGYMLSETRIVGPILTLLIMVATLFQLNQYIAQKGGHFLGI